MHLNPVVTLKISQCIHGQRHEKQKKTAVNETCTGGADTRNKKLEVKRKKEGHMETEEQDRKQGCHSALRLL